MVSSAPTLLLTGATGLVGRELIQPLLSARPDRRLLLLTRQRARLSDCTISPQVSVVEGDLREPDLGIDPAVVTEVIHCAADTRFGLPLADARAANVTMTENLLRFARRCRRLEKFAHVSTAYVAGRTTGRIEERYLDHQNGYVNTYQQSKHEAEERVVRAMEDLPVALYRFSSIIGDSVTGKVKQFNYVHQLIKLLPRNVMPVVPGDAAAPIDLIPTDWAVGALATLFDSQFVAGRVHQICAGAERSLTVRQVIDRTVSVFQRHPKAQRFLPLRVPALVTMQEYEQYVEKRLSTGDPLLKELVRVIGLYLPHLALAQAFDNTSIRPLLDALPPIAETYENIVAHCIDTNWGLIMYRPRAVEMAQNESRS